MSCHSALQFSSMHSYGRNGRDQYLPVCPQVIVGNPELKTKGNTTLELSSELHACLLRLALHEQQGEAIHKTSLRHTICKCRKQTSVITFHPLEYLFHLVSSKGIYRMTLKRRCNDWNVIDHVFSSGSQNSLDFVGGTHQQE